MNLQTVVVNAAVNNPSPEFYYLRNTTVPDCIERDISNRERITGFHLNVKGEPELKYIKVVETLPSDAPQLAPVDTVQTFEGFRIIALRAASLGLVVFPILQPKAKYPPITDFPNLATTNPAQIESWSNQYPNSNAGAIARPDKHVFIDEDNWQLIHRLYQEKYNEAYPQTYTTESQPGHRQSVWLQTDKTRSIGNVLQSGFKDGIMSFRQNNEYILIAGSAHPSGSFYKIVDDSPIVAMPDKLADFILSMKKEEKIKPSIDGDKIPYGQHDSTLTSIAGGLRHKGMEVKSLTDTLIEICEKRCENYGTDYRQMCAKIAESVCRYPTGVNEIPLIGGKPAGTNPINQAVPEGTPLTRNEIDLTSIEIPKFPLWVMEGTSLYENLVKPACDGSAKHPEFVFMPAFVTVMNYLSGRVSLISEEINMVQFLGLISPPGNYGKSSSCKLAFEYLGSAGIVTDKPGIGNADGQIVISVGGSPEGFGNSMMRLNAKNAILFYDELGKLAGKAGIENSTFAQELLTMAERNLFQNTVKARKDSFCFPAGSYAFTWVWATTTRGYPKHWAKLSGISSGLDDRMFYTVYEGKQKTGPNKKINLLKAVETRKLIDQAVNQGKFAMYDYDKAEQIFTGLHDNLRSENRAKAFALTFAVDLGRQIIDEDCIRRGIALADYAWKANEYLMPPEADNAYARLECEIVREIRRHGGYMRFWDLHDEMHGERNSAYSWKQAYAGVLEMLRVVEWWQVTKSGRKERMVGVLKKDCRSNYDHE